MKTDIRDKAFLTGRDVAALNFINLPDKYQLRRHYRQGLRSHIMEVLNTEDLVKESKGEMINGIRCFPPARPVVMLRILRNRFSSRDEILEEISKYTLVLKWLGREFIAGSEEFIVDYTEAGRGHLLLCGFQEYAEGDVFDPWSLSVPGYLTGLFNHLSLSPDLKTDMLKRVEDTVERFVNRVKRMIIDTGYIPDLAGIGNLILTRDGNLKLVDINNIMEIRLDDEIRIDDKGYPACDKSVEVVSILETQVIQRQLDMTDPLYAIFMSRHRQEKISVYEQTFYESLASDKARS